VPVDPVHWLSRPAGAGLVALRQTFVRRCHGGLGSSRACRVLAIQNMTAGQSAFGAVKFSAKHQPSLPLVPAVHWQIDFLVPLAPRAGLLLCAKHLFVAAIWQGFIRACRESANQAMTAGRPRLEPVKCSGAAKAKRRRHHRQARFAPCPEICYSAPKICSWQPRCQFFPAGGQRSIFGRAACAKLFFGQPISWRSRKRGLRSAR
jgi:hypothetical protein